MKPWTDPEPPSSLTSIILVTFNKVEFTLRCIESIYAHTKADFEVIVLDNASSDTTVEDVKALELPRLTVIANPTNDGFGKGCNLGAAAASGEHLVFLNNDTLVTPGWLTRMHHKLSAHPRLGMVGPMTNQASNAQLVAGAKACTASNHIDVAARIAGSSDGELILERRLIGFCLLIPKTVWDEVGFFDERYGVGHYEDDDLCAKVQSAGYVIGVARDAYIYHQAGQSFVAAGIERVANMRRKAFIFYKKWGNRYLDWPDLKHNIRELTHVVALVGDAGWTPPTWSPDKAPFLVTAVCNTPRSAVRDALQEAYASDLIYTFRTAKNERSLSEAISVGMRSHTARGHLIVTDSQCVPASALAHAERHRPQAAMYTQRTNGTAKPVGLYMGQEVVEAMAPLRSTKTAIEAVLREHATELRAAGFEVMDIELDDEPDVASSKSSSPPLPAMGSLQRLRSTLANRAAEQKERQHWSPPKPLSPLVHGKLVNITMLSYNRLDFTKRSVTALREHTEHPFCLVVVDNGSDAETIEWLKDAKRRGAVDILILNGHNRGVAPGANQGWQALRAPYYVKLDNDIVLTRSGWLKELVAAADTIPKVGMIGYNFEEISYPATEVAGLRVRPRPVHLGGACILIGPQAHAAAGYWCEDYLPYSEEDFDMGFRLELAGFRHFYMDDEEAGLHLPNERATRLVDGKAKDDEGDPAYRSFKDEARLKHIGTFSTVWTNCQQYRRGLRPLRYEPGRPHEGLQLKLETALFRGLRSVLNSLKPKR